MQDSSLNNANREISNIGESVVPKLSNFIIVLLFSFLLSGCSGGGGSTATPSPGNPSPSPGGDLQTSVPAPNYGLNGRFQELLFNDINTMRASLGLGLLAQASALDSASDNHMRYYFPTSDDLSNERILENPSSGSAPFTGIAPQDRCGFAGYAGACPDIAQWGASIGRATDRYTALLLLTQGAREIGLSEPNSIFLLTVHPFIQLGYPDGITPQKQGPDFRLATALGGAFHVHVNDGETLDIHSFRVWNDLGAELSGSIVTHENDPLQRMPAHGAMFVPAETLPACDASTYVLSFSGMRDGRPFTLTQSVNFWRSPEGQCY